MAERTHYYQGVGRRKTATATIRLTTGAGRYFLNDQEKPTPLSITKVFESVDLLKKMDVSVVSRGGGYSSQEGAVVLGVARAILELKPDLRSTLRKAGYLTRDSRSKERKKPGLKRARRAPQWAKR